MSKFVQLHIHGQLGSTLDAVADSSDYVKKAREYGHEALAITDHGRLSGIFHHQQVCKSAGIKPILGLEAYVNGQLVYEEEGKRKRRRDNHIILLAANKTGYQNLCYLNYISMRDEEHFYYSPRITFDELFQNSEGLYCGSACIASPFSSLLRRGENEEADKMFECFLDVFKDRFYAEVQFNELTNQMDDLREGQKTYNEWIINKANKHGIPVVLTGDVHYAQRGQDQLQTLSIAIRDGATIDNLSFELESKNLYYHDVDDYKRFNKEFGYNYREDYIETWCENSTFIASKIDYVIPERTKLLLPKVSDDDEILLIKKSKEGLIKYFGVKEYGECPANYRKRLEIELSVIIRKGFCSYLLILEDIFQFAEKEKLPHGPARGSAAGSLVVYCLGITTLDPLKYDLLFERFLSTSRSPDVVYNYFND